MRPQRWRGLPLQLFILTVLPLTVLLLAIAFGSLALHQEAMRSMVGERDERATRAAASAIAEQLNHRRSAIRGLALQAGNALGPAHVLADAAFLLPDFEGGIALFRPDGAVLAASDNPDHWPARAAAGGLQLPREAGDPEPSWFSAPFIDPVSDESWMLVTAATETVVAVGAFSPASLARQALADLFAASELATAYVISADGSLVYQIGTLLRTDTPTLRRPGVADALRGESGTTYLTAAGEEYVIAFSPIAPVGWALVMEEPWRAVSDPLLRTTELAPLILIPVLVIALTALWFGVRQVVQPLQTLEKQAIALGWGDFTAIEEPVGGIGEIRRLQAELIHMAQKVSLAQQSLRGYLGAVTLGQEEERRRLARELHDDTIQSLIALNQQIQLAQIAAEEGTAAERLATMGQMAEQLIADLRRLTRDLRPIYLEDLGLVPALDMLARDMQALMAIPVALATSGPERRLPANVELALYRIAQESLSNVWRHARARRVELHLAFTPERISLSIRDDGVGFAVPESPAQMAAIGHYGLLGMQERAEGIGARMTVDAEPGAGTTIAVHLQPRGPA